MEVTCWLESCWVKVLFILKNSVHCASWCAFSSPMLFGALEDFKHPAVALGCKSCGKPGIDQRKKYMSGADGLKWSCNSLMDCHPWGWMKSMQCHWSADGCDLWSPVHEPWLGATPWPALSVWASKMDNLWIETNHDGFEGMAGSATSYPNAPKKNKTIRMLEKERSHMSKWL